MCAFLVQIIYGFVATFTLVLTSVSLGMDAWSKVADGINSGLFCDGTKIASVASSIKTDVDPAATMKDLCPMDLAKFMDMPYQAKLIFAFLVLAIVMEVVCITYNFFTAFACCCKSILLHILLALSLIVVLFLVVVVGSAVSMNSERMAQLEEAANSFSKLPNEQGALQVLDNAGTGKSFIIAAVALAGSIVNAVVCVVAICFAKKM